MKKITKYFDLRKILIITVAVIIAFPMTTCINEIGGDEPLPINYGDKLTLFGDVDLEMWSAGKTILEDKVSYPPFFGELTIMNTYGGSGRILSGKLNYSIDKPTGLYPLPIASLFKKKDYGLFHSSGDANGVALSYLGLNSDSYSGLFRGVISISDKDETHYITEERVIYVYVDKDVTVSGYGWDNDVSSIEEDEITYIKKETVGRLNLELKAGWNTVYEKTEISISTSIIDEEVESYSITETYKMSLENPSDLRWYLRI
jgi:hypothetical protein